jgi:hypothetical protein
MENIITLLFVISLSIIYTFLNDINSYKKHVIFEKYKIPIQVMLLIIFIIGIVSIDSYPVKILIMIVYLKFNIYSDEL